MCFHAAIVGIPSDKVPPFGNTLRSLKSLGDKATRSTRNAAGTIIQVKGNIAGAYIVSSDVTTDVSNLMREIPLRDYIVVVSFEENRIEDAFVYDLMRLCSQYAQITGETRWSTLLNYINKYHKEPGFSFGDISQLGFGANLSETLEDLLLLMERRIKDRNHGIHNQLQALIKRYQAIESLQLTAVN